MQHKVHK